MFYGKINLITSKTQLLNWQIGVLASTELYGTAKASG
jgi:hypothetical protein